MLLVELLEHIQSSLRLHAKARLNLSYSSVQHLQDMILDADTVSNQREPPAYTVRSGIRSIFLYIVEVVKLFSLSSLTDAL